jgi:hypothetical protein
LFEYARSKKRETKLPKEIQKGKRKKESDSRNGEMHSEYTIHSVEYDRYDNTRIRESAWFENENV